nr:hypothetical protein [Rhizobium sullae]
MKPCATPFNDVAMPGRMKAIRSRLNLTASKPMRANAAFNCAAGGPDASAPGAEK